MKLWNCAKRAGFTMLELTMGVLILLLLVGSLFQALTSLSMGGAQAEIQSELQAQGERALRAIIDDLKPSGFDDIVVGGVPARFPSYFVDGNALNEYAVNAHPPAVHHAQAGDVDFGPNREIAFLQPADLNGDGRPDVDGGGQLVWSVQQFSYVVVTRADGVNVLQRRRDGVSTRQIAHHVERITFDDVNSVATIPLGAVRARIWLRRVDDRGAVHRHYAEAVVNLRNGEGT